MPLVLVVTANSRTSALQLSEEVRRIRGALGESANFTVVHEAEIRAADLIRRLLEDRPDILHFAGHGAGKDEKAISVKGDDGGQAILTDEDLATIFGNLPERPSLVVLNACWSNEMSAMLSRWAKVVVGAGAAIPDSVAHRFAGQFYEAIGHSLPVGKAVELARTELSINRIDKRVISVRARDKRDLQLAFAARPELMARFKVGGDGVPVRQGRHYDVVLWLRGVDRNISSVTFQICHGSYRKKDRFWETTRSEASDFSTDDFTADGEVTIRATAWFRDRGVGTESGVAAALRRNYGDSPTPAIKAAIDELASR